jgi:ElaA protein
MTHLDSGIAVGGPSNKEPGLRWQWYPWQALPPDVLYAFLKLRSDVFVVEQNCVFSDMDGIDPQCEHLCGFAADGALQVYLRLLPPGVKLAECSIGRLVTAPDARRGGLARAACERGLQRLRERFPGQMARIGGQQYMEAFYASLGFVTTGKPYLEDGIPHVEMLLRL